ncbi:reverse transcriptase family protein [Salinicola halophyticus]|uniref:reverse transcriptase family protein n=1 Tax=Salinicola halophyticus TaxID=1808881 RepID=UPI003F4757DB
MHKYKINLKSISNTNNLAKALGVSIKDINEALALPAQERYKPKEIEKSDGRTRVVYKPHFRIRQIQRKINTRIFADPNIVSWPYYLFGSIPNTNPGTENEVRKDYIECARRHCGAKSILRIDVKDFFDNIHIDLVTDVFTKTLHLPDDVATTLANICTYEEHLVQGALTSAYLSCLCLDSSEDSVVKRLERKGLIYTRYVDDIVVSSKKHDYDFSMAKKLIIDMLHSKDLPVNEAKTKVQRASSEPLTVHGMRINFSEPRLPSDEVRKIRSAVKNLEKVAGAGNYRMTNIYKQEYNKCLGKVNKLARVKHKQHRPLLKRVLKIKPLPSKKQIDRLKSMIRKLKHDYNYQYASFWYKKRYHLASEKLNVVKRSYPTIAQQLRQELKSIQPQFKEY